jgi:putative heme-binding domain-containing protein
VDLAFLPGTDQLVVADQGGRVWSFSTRADTVKADLVFDLRRHHQPLDSILGFTFHPGFATNRFVFINYNEPGGRTNGAYVSRFTLSSLAPPQIDPGSEKVIIRWLSGGHNGCTLAFGPDGFLYISTGDADDPDPPDGKRKTGQDLTDLLANILRIDVDHPQGTNAYAVPRDNPFLNIAGARPEIWAFGFRNPFRMSFAPDGALWAGDVGWEQWEMIYRVRRGGNYGWSITEGPNQSVRTDVSPGPGPILPPLVALPHTDAASITGGQVYRGRKLPKLRGAYLYGDWETGRFWALRNDGDKLVSNDELCDTALKPVSFTLDGDGELLILDYNGGLYEIVPNRAPPANLSFPRKLSETGLFASRQPLQPAPGVIPYQINAPMWNDHATAELLLGVPRGEAIVTSGGVGNIAGATWFFPTNTVLARTLTLNLQAGNAASGKRIETQVLHWDGQGWNPYSFRWNRAQTDADLVSNDGTNATFDVSDPAAPGGVRPTNWRFMARSECLRCHNAWAGDALTLNWLQLGRETEPLPGRIPRSAPSELQRLSDLGVLRIKGAPKPSPSALVNPYDRTLPLDLRARSWLHANCAGCHRFGAGGAVAVHLNFDKPQREMRAIDEKPTRGDFGLVGARIIAPDDPYRSTLFYRINTEGSGHMPHIGARLVDENGSRLVRDWIRSLPVKPEDAGLVAAQKLDEQIQSLLRGNNFPEVLATMNGAVALASSLSAPASLRDPASAVAAAIAHTNALVRDLFQRFVPPNQRRQTLGADFKAQTVLAAGGNAARGKELFLGVSQCARCHVCAGQGRAFGPDLTNIGTKYNRSQLLDQILHPSKVIAPEFKTSLITLRDDTEFSGFIIQRTADEIILREETLAERHIPRADVKDSRESLLSAMPEGLLAPLTAQEAADLLEYLGASQAGAKALH